MANPSNSLQSCVHGVSAYQCKQTRKDAASDGALRLAFVAGDDVAYDAQRGRLNLH